ncbi:hypothetical protein B0T26DRAFT_617104, partial [Lasiosphaeria miniovina]
AASIPPALPPSVEEAYRRKCIQLKQRTNEVEEANDAARLRLARLKRQVEKMRLERAFLLEQLAKRTSVNVEDSDGSPSPPPTPKEKPLRIKRGHRKPSMIPNLEATPSAAGGGGGGGGGGSASFVGRSLHTHSPSSDTFSAQHLDGQTTNGVHKAPRKPGNAFDLYCDENRDSFKDKSDDAGAGVEEELARGWKDLPETQREEFQTRAEDEMAKYHAAKEDYDEKAKARRERSTAKGNDADDTERRTAAEEARADQAQEDIEMDMGNYDTDQETQGEKPDE